MSFGRLMLDDGMAVVDGNAVPIGHVKQRRETDFVVSLADGRELSLPYEAIQALMGNRIVLQPHAAESHAGARPS